MSLPLPLACSIGFRAGVAPSEASIVLREIAKKNLDTSITIFLEREEGCERQGESERVGERNRNEREREYVIHLERNLIFK